jgi:hypothetical protein
MVRHIGPVVLLAGGLFVWLDSGARGDESDVIDCKIGDRQVKMMLTGSAVRSKSIFKIYAIDSYVEQGLKIRTARDMIDVAGPKQLHLVMLRDVAGPDMAEAFTTTLRSNHPAPAFEEEVKAVAGMLRGQTAHKGDEIWFTHIPRVGFQCRTSGGVTHLVPNVEFSKAVWENYFGKNNVGEHVKRGLLSRLPKE